MHALTRTVLYKLITLDPVPECLSVPKLSAKPKQNPSAPLRSLCKSVKCKQFIYNLDYCSVYLHP